MTTCEEMTFERLLAHVTHLGNSDCGRNGASVDNVGHSDYGDPNHEPTSDVALLHHIAFCDRCSARVLALRVQSLALATLGRGLRSAGIDPASEADGFSSSRDADLLCYGTDTDIDSDVDSDVDELIDGPADLILLEQALESDPDVRPDLHPALDGGDGADDGPGACLGAVRDAGLANFHQGLRELYRACLWGDPRRARQLGETSRPRCMGEIALDLTSLAKRLSGLGLAITADDLPTAMPSPQQVVETAGPLLDRITALEGPSPWVARARSALRGG